MGESGERPTGDHGTFSTARLAMARLRVTEDRSLAEACASAADVSARALKVERVGIWMFDEDRTMLRCEHLHAPDAGRGPNPRLLHAADYPHYVAALTSQRWVCVDDAQHDELTRELAPDYLAPLGITSMLDAPVFRHGELVGIVCHEHVGPMRHWTSADRAFAGSVADIIALAFEQSARLEVEHELRVQAERLRQAHEMEALGRLAAGCAHDVNNLFAAIDNLAVLIARAQGVPERVLADARGIREVAHRGTQLARHLLAFSRQQPAAPRRIDVSETVGALDPILHAVVQGRCKLAIDAPRGAGVVLADPVQIEQIVLNLVLNARDAMPDGGTVDVKVVPHPDAHEASIAVADSGTGMDEATRARIFEPYFTTKAPHEGSGLGLATVYGVVQQLGGRIDVHTAPGRGSRFDVALPLVR